jgi:transcriptional repressor NrdR
MHCPFCHADKDSLKVIDSRTCEGGRAIRRRRECMSCNKRFTTYERIEETQRLIVIKRDGRRVPWDRGKVRSGLERACFKRAVAEEQLLRIVDEVEETIFRTHDREVGSSTIGELVSDHLRRLDQVAYVRFASVYRQFRTLEELVDEARAVLDAHRFEDPTQGKLFVEPPVLASVGNGDPAGAPGEARPRGRRRTRQVQDPTRAGRSQGATPAPSGVAPDRPQPSAATL